MASGGYKKGVSIIVNHLPPDIRRTEIEGHFGAIGPIKRCHMVRDKNGESKGLAYIIFNNDQHAIEAVKNLHHSKINGKTVHIKFSNRKHNLLLEGGAGETGEKDGGVGGTGEKFGGVGEMERKGGEKFGGAGEKIRGVGGAGEKVGGVGEKFGGGGGGGEKVGEVGRIGEKNRGVGEKFGGGGEKNEGEGREKREREESEDEKMENLKRIKSEDEHPKNRPNKSKNRDGRIIIRNLSFKVNEQILSDHFGKFGSISEVNILKRKDGRMVGCAFIQYGKRTEALDAIKECNMKPLLGRPVAVDICVPKEKFAPKPEIKIEKLSDDEEEDKKSASEASKTGEIEYLPVKKESEASESEDEGIEEDSEPESASEASENEDEDMDQKPAPKRASKASKDVSEGRTIFIKNLSFDVTEGEIESVLSMFGDLKYVLICIDKLTEHPRGTAFAQFMTKESADACLEAESDPSRKPEFVLHGRQMHIMRAISRSKLTEQQNEKKDKTGKDKRNLYLAREGFVREGTQAAEGVSKPDLQLRVQREQVKRKMLQNLHIFVSQTRLCIHNLPNYVGDEKLFSIFKKHAGPGAKITEARVMRDLKDIDVKGHARSKGYGFVTFTNHENALTALRNINNNPEIFTENQRPIVEFSLENRAVLNARMKRMEKSKEKNPLFKKQEKEESKIDNKKTNVNAQPSFMGARSNPENKTLPTNFGAKKTKGKITRKQYRKEQRLKAMGGSRNKRIKEPNQEHVQNKIKKIKKQEAKKVAAKNKGSKLKKVQKNSFKSKRFDSMVQQYKQKIAKASQKVGGKKWYEG